MLRKIVVIVFVGAISFPITNIMFSSLLPQLAMAVAFGGVILFVQFLVDFERRLAQVEVGQAENAVEVQRTVARGFSNVNEATRLFARSATVDLRNDAVVRLAKHAAEIGETTPRLIADLAWSEIDRVADFLNGVLNHEVTYDGEDQKWILGLTRQVMTGIDVISLPWIASR